MQKINFSEQIYEQNVLLGCNDILKNMMSKASEDQRYRIVTDDPITPGIPAVLLKSGFDVEIFLSDDAEIANCLDIFCQKDIKNGEIRKISGTADDVMIEKYRKSVDEYINSEECKSVLKKIEKDLGEFRDC